MQVSQKRLDKWLTKGFEGAVNLIEDRVSHDERPSAHCRALLRDTVHTLSNLFTVSERDWTPDLYLFFNLQQLAQRFQDRQGLDPLTQDDQEELKRLLTKLKAAQDKWGM